MGELPESVRDALGATQMRALRGMRDRLSHNDRATNLDIVWVAATRDLPVLRDRVRALLRQG
ncbi:HepT-like ribonuclease domain-containing protein [Mobilicoccus caccae]|uniref:HepT-like ribonuclease domain-containing protein n=1 Tax=Mobilicoccus caccae TaxID=1859295 RepID=UPI0032AF459F